MDFYKDFSLDKGYLEIEKFLQIKLFFEYDENNEVIKNELKTVKFEYIKRKLFEFFKDEKEEFLNFNDMITHFGYLYEIFEEI